MHGVNNGGESGTSTIAPERGSDGEQEPFRYPNVQFHISETGMFGNGVLVANPSSQLTAALHSLREALPDAYDYLRAEYITGKTQRLNNYLANTVQVVENGEISRRIRSEVLPIDEVIGTVLKSQEEQNHPVHQLLVQIFDAADRLSGEHEVMPGRDRRILVRNLLKITNEAEIRREYKKFMDEQKTKRKDK